jgi:CheY-like chemotaxis protein
MTEPFAILVAEDNDHDVFLMSRALQNAGISGSVHFVSDGQFAMDYLAGAGKYADRSLYPLPTFAFFDVKMPRMTGFDALAWARGKSEFEDLPILILSSSSEERDIKRAHDLGANSYFVKTPSVEDLATELKRFCYFWWPMAIRGIAVRQETQARVSNEAA